MVLVVVPGEVSLLEVLPEAVEVSLLEVGVVRGVVADLPHVEAEVEAEVALAAVDVARLSSSNHSRTHRAHYLLQFVPMEFGDEEKLSAD